MDMRDDYHYMPSTQEWRHKAELAKGVTVQVAGSSVTIPSAQGLADALAGISTSGGVYDPAPSSGGSIGQFSSNSITFGPVPMVPYGQAMAAKAPSMIEGAKKLIDGMFQGLIRTFTRVNIQPADVKSQVEFKENEIVIRITGESSYGKFALKELYQQCVQEELGDK